MESAGAAGAYRAVLFDFDGTLTRPGAIDFSRLRALLGCPPKLPILEYIDSLPDARAREQAHRALDGFELEAARASVPNDGAERLVRACAGGDRRGHPDPQQPLLGAGGHAELPRGDAGRLCRGHHAGGRGQAQAASRRRAQGGTAVRAWSPARCSLSGTTCSTSRREPRQGRRRRFSPTARRSRHGRDPRLHRRGARRAGPVLGLPSPSATQDGL